MLAIDTNILVRAFAPDPDTSETTRAQQDMSRNLIASGRDLFIPLSVVVEFEWVMRYSYDANRAEIADVIERLSHASNVSLDRAAAVITAADLYRHGLDFADALHLCLSRHCDEFATFDQRFANRASGLGLRPAVVAPADSVTPTA